MNENFNIRGTEIILKIVFIQIFYMFKENETLRGIPPKNYSRPELDKGILGKFAAEEVLEQAKLQCVNM